MFIYAEEKGIFLIFYIFNIVPLKNSILHKEISQIIELRTKIMSLQFIVTTFLRKTYAVKFIIATQKLENLDLQLLRNVSHEIQELRPYTIV